MHAQFLYETIKQHWLNRKVMLEAVPCPDLPSAWHIPIVELISVDYADNETLALGVDFVDEIQIVYVSTLVTPDTFKPNGVRLKTINGGQIVIIA